MPSCLTRLRNAHCSVILSESVHSLHGVCISSTDSLFAGTDHPTILLHLTWSEAPPCHLGSRQHHHKLPRYYCLSAATKNGANGEGGVAPKSFTSFCCLYWRSTCAHGMLFHPASIFRILSGARLRRHGISWSAVFCSTPSLKPSCAWHPPMKTLAYVLMFHAGTTMHWQRPIWWRHHERLDWEWGSQWGCTQSSDKRKVGIPPAALHAYNRVPKPATRRNGTTHAPNLKLSWFPAPKTRDIQVVPCIAPSTAPHKVHES